MTSRTPRILGAVAAAAILLAPTTPAHAATADDPVPIPAGTTTLTVTGHGWGHGHGMSQWGAQGAALQGLSYDQILAFYYPGTNLSALGGGRVKVLITGDTDDNLKVKDAPGLKLVDLGRHRTYRLGKVRRAKAWKLRVVNGQARVYVRTGHWHRYRPRGHAYLLGDGQFKSTSHRVTLKLPSGPREYRGALRFTSSDTVNVLGMEKYLRGVVPAEAITSWRPAALQAQAVAARSYAAFERDHDASGYFDVYDSTRSQAYRGVAIEDPNTDAAIAATADRIVSYGGQVAFTQFSASSGGWTATGSMPYLIARQDDYTTQSADPNLNWTVQVPIAKLQSTYPGLGALTQVQITARDGSNVAGQGWVTSIVLTGTAVNGQPAPTQTISGDTFKSLYGLKSAYFSLSVP